MARSSDINNRNASSSAHFLPRLSSTFARTWLINDPFDKAALKPESHGNATYLIGCAADLYTEIFNSNTFHSKAVTAYP